METLSMHRLSLVGIVATFLLALTLAVPAQDAVPLRFEVSLAKGLLAKPTDGRLLVILGKKKEPEPRTTIGSTGMHANPILGIDVNGFTPDSVQVLDHTSTLFPIESLHRLPPGDYFAQAVFDHNPDLRIPNAAGNLFSEPVAFTAGRGGTVRLTLTKAEPEDRVPDDEEHIKYHKFRSEKLSRFHGRPMFLRVGVILPHGYASNKDRTYPLLVRIGGFGTRFTVVRTMLGAFSEYRSAWADPEVPPFIVLQLDGAGPFGDPYQVNSANNGPYGDAIIEELIPFIEKQYRAIGRPQARFLEGASTGGWVSLALQIFYPDFFNGTWSHCPDPVDFRAYELINLYVDANAFVNRHGFERPSSRELDGEIRTTVRHEVLLESVLGRGSRWQLSGKDWASWNAVFGPRGADGLPRPVWDGKTGAIDRAALERWEQYDLRRVLQKNWPTIGPKLRGKLHIYVGEADDYYLNNAVHLLDDFLKKARPDAQARITFASRMGHSWRGISEKRMLQEMAERVSGR
jgi:S-formylglutathione hydrolase FrmB